jgi:uncharacterized protein YdeI (YjbR/CyaY-like superfamily)
VARAGGRKRRRRWRFAGAVHDANGLAGRVAIARSVLECADTSAHSIIGAGRFLDPFRKLWNDRLKKGEAMKTTNQNENDTMTNGGRSPKIDAYLRKAKKWQPELAKLRTILLGCQLTEDLKWGKPCYAYQKHNVLVILPLKEHCALLFFKGGLLKDTHGILIKAGENTVAGRQIRLTSVRQIAEMETVLKGYIQQAIDVDKAGLKVQVKKVSELKIPEEFQNKLAENRALKSAFDGLTPGRQRGYIFYFSGAKQSQTRASRVEKCLPQIFKGKGLDDR